MDVAGCLGRGTLLNRYVLKDVLGVGGMGVVHAALDLENGRRVAVKLLKNEARSHRLLRRRFAREARAISLLDSPHIVKIHDARGVTAARPFLVMELLEGNALHVVLSKRGRLSAFESAEVVRQAASGVACAHAAGVVHRDLNPSNLFLVGERPVVKVLDFGLSKIRPTADASDEPDDFTRETRLGTTDYTAPEQILCARDADARSDVWSLGVVLYELLTGQMPFEADSTDGVINRIYWDEPSPIRSRCAEIPRALEELALRCLQKHPNARPNTAASLVDALARFMDEHGAHAA